MADNNTPNELLQEFLANPLGISKDTAQATEQAVPESVSTHTAVTAATTTPTKEYTMERISYNPDDFGGIPEPECWRDLRDIMNARVNKVFLSGPPGIGKSFAGMYFGDVSRGVERMSCTEDMTSADVDGFMGITKDGTFDWRYGAASRAWINGSRLIIDEIDKAGSDVLAKLLAFTDSAMSARFVIVATGETIVPAPGFSVVMTANITNIDELDSDALKDRFPAHIQINAPHPSALMQFPESQRMLAATLISSRAGNLNGYSQRVSLRKFEYFNQLLADEAFDLDRAAALAFGPQLAEQIVRDLRLGLLTTGEVSF